MSQSALVARIARLACAITAVAGCEGKAIRLGDSSGAAGALGTDGASGGSTGTAGATGTAGVTASCVAEAWNPPSNMTQDLATVWDFITKTYNPQPQSFNNFIWDQVIANQGYLNYCIRVDLETNPGAAKPDPITATQRDQIQSGLERVANAWLETWLKGYDCWPYGHIPVKIVGWAVSDKNTLGFTDSTSVYVGTMLEGAPACSAACGRFFHQDGDYSSCPGGAANHYDMSLWLTNGMGSGPGAGGDWGQRVDYAVGLSGFATGVTPIVEHDFGIGLGLPNFGSGGAQDFFTLEQGSGFSQASFVMMTDSPQPITAFDGWMARQQWVKFVKDRYRF